MTFQPADSGGIFLKSQASLSYMFLPKPLVVLSA